MATFNRAHLIEDTLESIVNQTHQDWECLIIDDGATDNTEEIVNKWCKKDLRFKYFKRTLKHQKGLPGCRNQGIKLSTGNYIIFFDDDDIVHPQNLELCLNYFKNNYSDFLHYNKKPFRNKTSVSFEEYKYPDIIFEINHNKIYESITNKLGLASCTVMWRKYVFVKYKFDESLQYAEEWDLYNRLIINGFCGHKIGNTLYFNRKHNESNTGEFFKGNKVRIRSKIKATIHVIRNLDNASLLNMQYALYFLKFIKKFNVYLIYKELLKSNSLTSIQKARLVLIYPQIKMRSILHKIRKLKII